MIILGSHETRSVVESFFFETDGDLITRNVITVGALFFFLKNLSVLEERLAMLSHLLPFLAGCCFNGPPNLFVCLHFRFYPVMIVAMVQ